jgi:Xaa-Pro aminopeptidase
VPGASFKELFTLAQEQYSRCGITPIGRFNHIGHNIGLETEERWLDNSASDRISPGMVINIELYSTADTGEQIGNEDTYVIAESGPERISRIPRQIEMVA